MLPRKEQSRAESYSQGDRVRAVINGVSNSAKGPQIVLSRTDPALLIKLFEQEVPEIYDGTVMIRGAVREAGDRAKVAVYSRERDIDPVGACVGMKGTRVQAIIRELRGEKIDIVDWSEDPVLFVTNALSPAKVQRVSIVNDARPGDGSGGRRQAAVAGHRQEGAERPAGSQADRLEDRHQERGREAARGRGAVRRARRRRNQRRGGAESAADDPPAAGDADDRRRDAKTTSRSGNSSDQDRRPAHERGEAPFIRDCLSTVRIFKVAELLETTSQEVLALLKRDHGIELKSASSTLEEWWRARSSSAWRGSGARAAEGRHVLGLGGEGRQGKTAAPKKGSRPSRPSRPRRLCRPRASSGPSSRRRAGRCG